MRISRIISALACLACLLSGCLTYDYLDPSGKGRTSTVGNPCPYPYRALEIRPIHGSELRITINAFHPKDYGLGVTTIFMAFSDRRIEGYNVGRFRLPPQRTPHRVAFPNGRDIEVAFPDGRKIQGALTVTSDALLFTYPMPEEPRRSFTVTFPDVEIDGERFEIGNVSFSPATETLYAINC